jgi:phosphate-selective porin O and P
MKTLFIAIITLLSVTAAVAQDNKNTAKFELGKGLDINLNNGEYNFNLNGFIQVYGAYRNEKDGEDESVFGVKNAFFGFKGGALYNKFTFMLELNFADSNPLMDAWAAYNWKDYLTISAGQKQTFTNNREMMMHEKGLSMAERSIVSQYFSGTGRELGLFFESRFHIGKVGLKPSIAITTGDGRNSFGSSSIDVDMGGLKYGGRLDVLPLGEFKSGNDAVGADFAREATPKLLIGGAMSYNDGASNKVGEGHGDFILYDKDGDTQLPALRKIAADLLFKWQGLSVMAEYVNTSGTDLKGIYTKSTGDLPLQPEEIANYLSIGNGYNVQVGYILKNGWAFDARYSKVKPEFKETAKSVFLETDEYAVSVAKYFIDNRLMCQGAFTYLKNPNLKTANEKLSAELSLQIIF